MATENQASKLSATWMQNEHRLIRQLMAELESHIRPIPISAGDEWLDRFRQLFGRFRAHMRGHMSAEESDGGFLEPVVEYRPTLSRQVERLRHEHVQIATWFDRILEEIVVLTFNDVLLIEDACQRVEHLMSAIRHHEEHEELLVTFVFSQDIGTKD